MERKSASRTAAIRCIGIFIPDSSRFCTFHKSRTWIPSLWRPRACWKIRRFIQRGVKRVYMRWISHIQFLGCVPILSIFRYLSCANDTMGCFISNPLTIDSIIAFIYTISQWVCSLIISTISIFR